MSPDDLHKRNSHPWKCDPTPIPTPSNDHIPHMSAKTKKPSAINPFSLGRMSNTLGKKTLPEPRNRTASSTSTARSAGQPPPRKKVKTEGRQMPRLGPEEIIDVEQLGSSSSDELLLAKPRRDGPQLDVQNGGRHAFDVESDTVQTSDSIAVASASRVRQDGPSTQALAKELGGRSNSPILQFDDDEQPSKVKEIVSRFENIGKQARPLDLRLMKNMKPKNSSDSVATSSSGFHHHHPKFFITRKYSLPLKACYIGKRLVSEDSVGPIHLIWNPSGSDFSISCKGDGNEIVLTKLDTDTDVDCVECPSENHDNVLVVKFFLRHGSYMCLPNPDQSPGPVKLSNITIKFDPTTLYTQLIKWLKPKVTMNHIRNPKQIWEMAERFASQHSDSEVTLEQAEAPISRASKSSRTSEARSQTDMPPDISDISKSGDVMNNQPFEPRRSTRIRTVKKPSPPVDPDEVILIYPQGVPGAINITNADVGRLQPGEFLNDTVIEFGLKLWHKELEASEPELAKQVHVFSSFFYKKLNKRNFEEGYDSVRKWTSKINLFDKKYIIVPINEHLHWYLAIIFMPEYILLPPPPQPNGQSAASRTRSRTSHIAKEEPKEAEEIRSLTENVTLAPDSRMEDEHELKTRVDEFSCTISVTASGCNSSDGMNVDVSLDEQEGHHSAAPSRPANDFAMDVDHIDKSEEDAVREQLRMTSPTVSELGSDRDRARQDTENMDVETGPPDKQTNVVSSRFFAIEPENRVELDSQGQQVARRSTTECKLDGQIREEEPDQLLEDEAQQQDSGSDPLQRTHIFTLDSLGTQHPQAARQLNKYLKMEAQDKLSISDTSDAVRKTASVPTQPNFCDCGIYLLHFAQTFMTDPVKYFKLIANDNKKKSLPVNERQAIWQDYRIGNKRQELADRIKELSEEWKKSRATKGEAKKDQAEVTQESDSSDIEYVDVTPAPAPGGGKTTKGVKIRRTKRIRG